MAVDMEVEDGGGWSNMEDGKPGEAPPSQAASSGSMDLDKGLGRSGGFIQYCPPFEPLPKRRKREEEDDSRAYQLITSAALIKRIRTLLNKVNASNINIVLHELLSESHLVPGRGLFARGCVKSQTASPMFTHVFAAVVAVVNTKFPEVEEVVLKGIVARFKRSFRRNDKVGTLLYGVTSFTLVAVHVCRSPRVRATCANSYRSPVHVVMHQPALLAAAKFVAHLVNQRVAHEVVALELLNLLLERPTDDSVEVSE